MASEKLPQLRLSTETWVWTRMAVEDRQINRPRAVAVLVRYDRRSIFFMNQSGL
jgi:hypothetical protein